MFCLFHRNLSRRPMTEKTLPVKSQTMTPEGRKAHRTTLEHPFYPCWGSCQVSTRTPSASIKSNVHKNDFVTLLYTTLFMFFLTFPYFLPSGSPTLYMYVSALSFHGNKFGVSLRLPVTFEIGRYSTYPGNQRYGDKKQVTRVEDLTTTTELRSCQFPLEYYEKLT